MGVVLPLGSSPSAGQLLVLFDPSGLAFTLAPFRLSAEPSAAFLAHSRAVRNVIERGDLGERPADTAS
jgi:hypothetical protein